MRRHRIYRTVAKIGVTRPEEVGVVLGPCRLTSIDAASEQLEMSRRTFTKLFAEITGDTWLRYLRRMAIEHAQRRLRQTGVPIATIAFECGFNDLSSVYRQFRPHCRTAARRRETTGRPVFRSTAVGGPDRPAWTASVVPTPNVLCRSDPGDSNR